MGLLLAPRTAQAAHRRPLLVVLLTIGLLGVASAALAYWTAQGHGTASTTTGTLAAPTAVTATAPAGSSTVSVAWTASAGSPTPAGYYVARTDATSSATAAACGTSATTLTTSTSCSDGSVPDGTYTYAVTAVYRSWTAVSGASASVQVASQVPTRLAFTTQPSANGTSQTAFAQQPVVTVLPKSSWTVTAGWVDSAVPPVPLPGCVVKASLLAAPAPTVTLVLTAAVKEPSVAVSV
jgi:hypothetical protein